MMIFLTNESEVVQLKATRTSPRGMVGAEGAKPSFSESRFLDFLAISHRKWTWMTYPPGDDIQKKFFSILYHTWPGPKNFLEFPGRLRADPSRLSNSHTSVIYIYIMSMYPVGQPFFEIEYAICFKRKAPSARK